MRLANLQQAKDATGLSVGTFRRWFRLGLIKAWRPGKRVLVDLDEIEKFVLAHPRQNRAPLVASAAG